jgi:hypothetical protein
MTMALVTLLWGVGAAGEATSAEAVPTSATAEVVLARGENPQAPVRADEIQAPRHRDSSPHPDEIQAPRTGEAA